MYMQSMRAGVVERALFAGDEECRGDLGRGVIDAYESCCFGEAG